MNDNRALSSKRALVIGFSTFFGAGRRKSTKRAIAVYLERWTTEYEVTWCSRSAQQLGHQDSNLSEISERVDIVAIKKSNLLNFILRFKQLYVLKYDVVVAAYPMVLLVWPLILLGKLRGAKTSIYIGNDIWMPPVSRRRSKLERLRAFFTTLHMNFLFHVSSLVICRGRHLLNKVSSLGHHCIETLPISLPLTDSEISDLQAVKREGFFLFVGKITEEKGALDLLESFDDYSTQHSTCPNLILAGTSQKLDDIKQKYSFNSKIEFRGFVNDPMELAQLIYAAGALLNPTRAHWEGIPRVLDEAVSLGTPVWTSPFDAIQLQFGDSVHYFGSIPPSKNDFFHAFSANIGRGQMLVDRLSGARAAADQHMRLLAT